MTTTGALAVVLLVLAATNVWVHLGPGRVHVVTGPLAAVLLLLVGINAAVPSLTDRLVKRALKDRIRAAKAST